MKTITDIIDPTIADLPETTDTLTTMAEHWERLVSLLPSVPTQTADSLPPCSYGIDSEFRPIDLNYKGRTRPITWDKLAAILQPVYPVCHSSKALREIIARNCDPSYHSSKALRETIARNCDLSYLTDHAELVTGEEVRESFCDQWRPGSCMGKREAQDWLDIYVNNPDDVGLLRFAAPLLDTSCGMSWLVWFGKSHNYFDKTYSTNNDSIVQVIKRRLAAHFNVPDPNDRPKRFRLFWNGERLPWMDALCRVPDYSEYDKYIVVSSTDGPECLNDQDGWHPDGKRLKCHCCGCEIDEDDSCGLDDGYLYCSECVGYCELCQESCLASELTLATVARQHRVYNSYGWQEDEVYCSEHVLSSDYTESGISSVYFPDGEGIDLASGETISPTETDHEDVFWCRDSEIGCTRHYVCCTDETPEKRHLLAEISGEYYDVDAADVWLQLDDDGNPESFRLRTEDDPAEWYWPETLISETHSPADTQPTIPPTGAAQFQPGDRVICIDAGEYTWITEDREYTVVGYEHKTHGTYLCIVNNTGGHSCWLPERFKPAPVLDNPPDMISVPRHTPEPPTGHRWLDLGEIIQGGDIYHSYCGGSATWTTHNDGQNITICPVRLHHYSTTRPALSPLSDGRPSFGWRYRQPGEYVREGDLFRYSDNTVAAASWTGTDCPDETTILTTEPLPSLATT